MSDTIKSGAAEAVAYELMQEVMTAEDRITGHSLGPGQQRAGREYILDLYAECLKAVKGGRRTGRPAAGEAQNRAVARIAKLNAT